VAFGRRRHSGGRRMELCGELRVDLAQNGIAMPALLKERWRASHPQPSADSCLLCPSRGLSAPESILSLADHPRPKRSSILE
jgi:hypothetical protein